MASRDVMADRPVTTRDMMRNAKTTLRNMEMREESEPTEWESWAMSGMETLVWPITREEGMFFAKLLRPGGGG